MRQVTSFVVRRAPFLSLAAFFCFAPFAFGGYVPSDAGSVAVILDNLKDAPHASLVWSTSAVSNASNSSLSHLIGSGPLGELIQDRKRVKVSEPQAMLTWALDFAGLAALVYYIRRRTTKVIAC